MQEQPEHEAELGTAERQLAERLAGERPVPAAGFRGVLGRYLAANDPGYGPRPEHLQRMVLSYLGAGLLLIVLAALIGVGAL